MEFYNALEPIDSFRDVFDFSRFRDVPREWLIAVTDVVNSTRAIAEGRYKQVNVAGSLGAMALANIKSDLEFPYVFGGDGMIYVLPPELGESARSVLADVRARVAELLGLELRAAIVPVSEIYEQGGTLKIGKLIVSTSYHQAVFAGNGLELAERLVKAHESRSAYEIDPDQQISARADLNGFSCRWKDIPSSKGEIVSLIVRAASNDEGVFRPVLGRIERLLGADDEYHPLSVEAMRIDTSATGRSVEAGAVLAKSSGFRYGLRMAGIRFEMAMTSVITALRLPIRRGKKRIRDVRQDNVLNSDVRKFDGTLKMVLATTRAQREVLERLLADFRRQGLIHYGVHISDRALMTCLIHFSSGSEVHFVDGADGGYALAARSLKQQLAEDGFA
ncbi:MAG: DUF3095 domain-containing protein [Spirochaetales bacterium]